MRASSAALYLLTVGPGGQDGGVGDRLLRWSWDVPPRDAPLTAEEARRSVMQSPPAPRPEGVRFGPYSVEGEIGSGAASTVFVARHLSSDVTVALKVLHQSAGEDPEMLRRFRQEADLQDSLSHPGVVAVHGRGAAQGVHYLALELVPGPSLEELLQGHSLDLCQGVSLLARIAHVLDYVHSQGIVHRDLKPANILVDADFSPHLTDFGLAVRPQSSERGTQTGTVLGSLCTMAPEQVEGDPGAIGPWTDVYALGAILYRLLSGCYPFVSEAEGACFDRILRGAPLPPGRLVSGVPPELEAICLRALETDARRRPQRAGELADGLGSWLEGRANVASSTVLVRPGVVLPAASTTALPRGGPPGQAACCLQPGDRVGGSEVVRVLGVGGMGEVYLAQQAGTGRAIALKVVKVDVAHGERRLRRFQREVRALARLDHPNVVGIHTAGVDGGLAFLAMSYLEGGALADRLAGSDVSLEEGVRLVRDAARGTGHAHALGVVHRDIKPGNILIDAEGSARVADFGVAVLNAIHADSGDLTRWTREGVLVGSAPYASPEQATGQSHLVTPASDVFSLGVVLYEVLCGRRPFASHSEHELLAQIVACHPDPPSQLCAGLPTELDWICLRALEKDPRDRYPDAAALAADLDRFLRGESPSSRAPSFVSRVRRRLGVRAWILAVAGGLILLALVAPLVLLSGESGAGQGATDTPPATPLANAASELLDDQIGHQLDRAQNALLLGCPHDALRLLEGLPESARFLQLRALAREEALDLPGAEEDWEVLRARGGDPIHLPWASAELEDRAVALTLEQLGLALKTEELACAVRARMALTLLRARGGESLATALEGATRESPDLPAMLALPLGLGAAWEPRELHSRSAQRADEDSDEALRRGDDEVALSLLQSAVERAPRDVRLRFQYASALVHTAKISEALRQLALGTALGPESLDDVPERILHMCETLGTQRVVAAVESFRAGPDPALAAAIRVHFNAARLLLGPKGVFSSTRFLVYGPPLDAVDLAETHRDALIALERYPTWFALRGLRGLLRLRLGHVESGQRDLADYLSVIDPDPHFRARALHLVAGCLATSGDLDAALQHLGEAAQQAKLIRSEGLRRHWGEEWALEPLRSRSRFKALLEGR